ncbi:MAG: SDR family NAD(P)-dependent oxidoreductase [Chloroflexi bacterium]|nr:MAG: SDR family NAD(P)-dependent oxidoreductase [Chloroflexota bacterium]
MTPKWTAADIPDQHGRTAVVTGANSGIGFFAARELARAGARVLLAVRNAEKGAEAARAIQAAVPNAEIEIGSLDLASLASVRSFADWFAREHDGLDLLINNAGTMAFSPRRETADGFEMSLGTNHLGHFALTGLLLGRMEGRQDARVVTISGALHRMGRINFDDLQRERRYGRWSAYAQSKLAVLLFAFELDRRLRAAGSAVRSLAAHPGYAATNIQTAAATSKLDRFFGKIAGNRLFAQSAEMGALPVLYAATCPGLEGGAHIGPGSFFESRGYPKQGAGSSAAARDEAVARKLWEVSEGITGVRFQVLGGNGGPLHVPEQPAAREVPPEQVEAGETPTV